MEPLSVQTRALIAASVKRSLGYSGWRELLDESGRSAAHLDRLYEVIVKVGQQHASSFARMCEMLQPTPSTAYPQFVGVTTQLFKQTVSWGRIVTLIAFGVHLGMYFREREMEEMVASVISWIQRLADSDLLVWIEKQGGWESFYTNYSTNLNGKGHGTSLATVGIRTAAFGAFLYITAKVV